MEVRTICNNPWLSLKILKAPEENIDGYVFSHETRCKGKIISIMPYRFLDPDKQRVDYLLRREVTPCWGFEPVVSSITGGYEGGDPRETAVLELKEEAGYIVNVKDILSLGTCFGTKSCDTVYYLYSVDLSNRERQAASGDGSALEKKAECFWYERVQDILFELKDPLSSVLFTRLHTLLPNGLLKAHNLT